MYPYPVPIMSFDPSELIETLLPKLEVPFE